MAKCEDTMATYESQLMKNDKRRIPNKQKHY